MITARTGRGMVGLATRRAGPGGEQGHLRKEDGYRRGTKEGQLGYAQAPAPTPAGGSGSGGAGRADADADSRGGGSAPCDKEKQPAHRSRAGRMRWGLVFRDHQQNAGSGLPGRSGEGGGGTGSGQPPQKWAEGFGEGSARTHHLLEESRRRRHRVEGGGCGSIGQVGGSGGNRRGQRGGFRGGGSGQGGGCRAGRCGEVGGDGRGRWRREKEEEGLEKVLALRAARRRRLVLTSGETKCHKSHVLARPFFVG